MWYSLGPGPADLDGKGLGARDTKACSLLKSLEQNKYRLTLVNLHARLLFLLVDFKRKPALAQHAPYKLALQRTNIFLWKAKYKAVKHFTKVSCHGPWCASPPTSVLHAAG